MTKHVELINKFSTKMYTFLNPISWIFYKQVTGHWNLKSLKNIFSLCGICNNYESVKKYYIV